MKQLSRYFVVVGETPAYTVCETRIEGHVFWRFVIAWDEDHDERVVSLVEHWIALGLFDRYKIRVLGERKGCIVVDGDELKWEHPDGWTVEGDYWNQIFHTEWDDVARLFSCGEVVYSPKAV